MKTKTITVFNKKVNIAAQNTKSIELIETAFNGMIKFYMESNKDKNLTFKNFNDFSILETDATSADPKDISNPALVAFDKKTQKIKGLLLRKRFNNSDFQWVEILSHEIVHILQYATDRLSNNEKGLIFDGEEIDINKYYKMLDNANSEKEADEAYLTYRSLPHEDEAYTLGFKFAHKTFTEEAKFVKDELDGKYSRNIDTLYSALFHYYRAIEENRVQLGYNWDHFMRQLKSDVDNIVSRKYIETIAYSFKETFKL